MVIPRREDGHFCDLIFKCVGSQHQFISLNLTEWRPIFQRSDMIHIGENYHRRHWLAGSFDSVKVSGHQQISVFDLITHRDMRHKWFAIKRHRVNADMDQHFQPSRRRDAHRMFGWEHSGHFTCNWRNDFAIIWFNSETITEHFFCANVESETFVKSTNSPVAAL